MLGNHDFGDARDPLASPSHLEELAPARLLRDESLELELRGRRVQIVGVDPTSYRAGRANLNGHADATPTCASSSATTPRCTTAFGPGAFHLVLAGHLHDGQIAIPYGVGKVRLAHLSWRYTHGFYRRDGVVHARLAGPRHDVRPVPLLRPPRGDRARAAGGRLAVDIETAIGSVLAAFGLSGAAGLNAWLPLFVSALLHRLDVVELSNPFDELATTTGLIVLGTLTVLDFVGDKIPVIDHALHARRRRRSHRYPGRSCSRAPRVPRPTFRRSCPWS